VISTRYHGQAHEGKSPSGLSGEEGKSPREGKAQEGRCFRSVQTPIGSRNVCRVPSPEVEAPANHMRVAALERVFDSVDDTVPEGQNPMGVAGMKQGRPVAGG